MLKKLWFYLNPLFHIGETYYPLKFPLFTTIIIYVLIELFGVFIFKHPNDIGNIIIFTNFALILYFSFRSAMRGGLVVLGLSTLYYAYFLYSRNAPFSTKEMAALVAALLSLTNLGIVLIVGWHRQFLDDLLDKERTSKIEAERGRRQVETMLQQFPVGVIIAKYPSGEVISRNERAVQLLGYPSHRIKAIKDYRSLNATRNGEKIRPQQWPITRALREQKTIAAEEIILTTKKGQLVIACNAAPIYDKQGKIIAAVTTFYDITKQKELEKHKDDFVAMVSHELKTPLTSAKLYTQAALKRIKEDKKNVTYIQKTLDQLNQLGLLVTTILDTTRMEQGRLILNDEPFALKPIVEKTIADLEENTGRKITLEWQTQEYLYGNKERISQIFTNLITNAIKFSQQDSPIIVRSQKKNGVVIVSVQDFGVGLSKEDQQHIFDKFYQAGEHNTYPGIGLGLYITSEIVKLYKGKIWVESTKGKGSTFYFSLPIYTEGK